MARRGGRLVGVVASAAVLAVEGAGPAEARHWSANGWRHDHSSAAIFPRPDGLAAIEAAFGRVVTGCSPYPCSCPQAAKGARTWFPHACSTGGAYVEYHSRLATNVGNNVRGHIGDDHREGALYYGIYGYNCRYQTGSTTKASLHAWGASRPRTHSISSTRRATEPFRKEAA